MSEAREIKKVLVANRGEIACRVFQTARSLGYETVAVYSEADADALHVKQADDVRCIGPAPVGESYLCADKILNVAKECGADAIHPGYGFLSENAEFAKACVDAGLIFIGPDAHAIDLMGNKAAAKRHMIDAGVPCVPGYQGDDQSDTVMGKEAERIGFPVMVKAAAGGGGRGMRLVEKAEDLKEALARARSEAQNAFGSDELILEKAIIAPRHVEIQVFADKHGNAIHLGERDCSVQRRHQKVIEEAPCPVMTEELRSRMGQAAVDAAKSINYVGAGTVEFLLDASGEFYFLEMNTRLQVEHPVTEMVTGLDLVALQLAVAEGKALPLSQEDVSLTGHAIEVRLYAEDPEQDFLPSSGTVELWKAPEAARTDAGIETGSEISSFYDPMLAKIIVHGETRAEACRKMRSALQDTVLVGPASNQSFLLACLEQDVFRQGKATTSFIADHSKELAAQKVTATEAALAAVLDCHHQTTAAFSASLGVASNLRNWASASALATPYVFEREGEPVEMIVQPLSASCYRVNDQVFDLSAFDGPSGMVIVGDQRHFVHFHKRSAYECALSIAGKTLNFENLVAKPAGAGADAQGGQVTAPMHGQVLDVHCAVGDVVEKGQVLAVLEAMKMQHQILASISGTIKEVSAEAGAQIAADSIMFEIEGEEGA